MLNDCERNVHLAKLNSLSAKLMHFVFITAQVKQQWTKIPKKCFLFINYEQLSGAQVVAKHWMEVIYCGKGQILKISCIWNTFSKNAPCLLDFAKFQSPRIPPEINENKKTRYSILTFTGFKQFDWDFTPSSSAKTSMISQDSKLKDLISYLSSAMLPRKSSLSLNTMNRVLTRSSP